MRGVGTGLCFFVVVFAFLSVQQDLTILLVTMDAVTTEQAEMETTASGKMQLPRIYHHCDYLEPGNVLTKFH